MRTIAVTSGKGGVGKTNLSSNLGIQLAQKGRRVVIFDADLGLANLDVVLGTSAQWNLQHVLSGQKRLQEIVQQGPGGVQFIAGGSGVEALVNLNGTQLERFLSELAEFEKHTDILIFDTGAGIDGNVMTFLQASDEVLLVVTPDPASMTDAYATGKALFMRKPDARVKVVMNMVADEAQGRAVYAKLMSITNQFLNKQLGFAGHIRHDMRALEWIRKRKPYSLHDPLLPASQDIKAIAANLLGEQYERHRPSLADKFRNVFGLGLKKSA